MPYIKTELRDTLDPHIELLAGWIRALDRQAGFKGSEGNMNYVITSLINKVYPDVSYETINRVMGILKCTSDEYYRRIAVPYENQKAYENNDVYPITPIM